jgi:hypothetical protein
VEEPAKGTSIRVNAPWSPRKPCPPLLSRYRPTDSSEVSPEIWTRWRSELNSNSRFRFLNWQTRAFRRQLQHSDESRFGCAGQSWLVAPIWWKAGGWWKSTRNQRKAYGVGDNMDFIIAKYM